VSICILNRNQREILKNCLESCWEEIERAGLKGEIIVVDNASSDGSPEMVAALFPQVRVIRNQENAGFSVANNRAIRVSTGRYVFILNNDTILHKDCLKELVSYMDAHPDVGAAGPKLLNSDGSVQVGYHRRLPRLPDTLVTLLWLHHVWPSNPITRRALLADKLLDEQREEPWPIEQVGGCALLLRREALDQVGGFDEAFCFWFEDVDLCERLGRGGWKIVYVPRPCLTHYGRASFAGLEAGETVDLYIKSLLLFFKKRRGPIQYSLVKLTALTTLLLKLPVVALLSISPKAETRREWRNAPLAYLRAFKGALVL
jgi:hypothetical protein